MKARQDAWVKSLGIVAKETSPLSTLLRSELGFWDKMCRENMPASKFLVQNDEFEFNELVTNSSLPSFITDVAKDRHPIPQNRIAIPISDSDANVSFYIAIKNVSKYQALLSKLK